MKLRHPLLSDARSPLVVGILACACLDAVGGCAGWPDSAPQNQTYVVLKNDYPASVASPLIIYDAYWLNISFAGSPIAPGASSDPQLAIPTSGDAAYVVLAPGWDPSSEKQPASLIVLQSRSTYALALGDTLSIAVDDAAFAGNCAAGSSLTQEQAAFLTEIVFAADFAGFTYDASTCTVTAVGEGGGGDAGAD